ncbi:hypothetical protein LNTAR_18223 [Lentisphaera araneosa HTCC2155]|uniref:Activator of Hsp90 ATPase 1 family protein n=1 Tax=Lentisphaera araneosa HTCC2155 TaxID=313628 RepID=A6DFY3_9BACT|nr:hypothetical protein [Lentisphaera araneosa]EDM29713.1 hypothetical protein LNTAR_18223 [Lentisphaera araneosa HTCC2155]
MQFEYISFISATNDKVWAYFEKAQLFSLFQVAPLQQFSFQEGKGFSLGTNDTPVLKAEFKLIKKYKVIHLSLNYSGIEGDAMIVKIIFYPLGEMSSLSIIIDDLKDDDSRLDVARNHWPGAISQLKTIIETGESLPWPQ